MSADVEITKQKGHRFLWIDDYLWMWDLPEEVRIQKSYAAAVTGNILVAGYGLGILQRYLAENPRVKYVLTVEKHAQVVEACRREFGKQYGFVTIEDFYEFETSEKFDFVIGDIWTEIYPQALPYYKRYKKWASRFLKQPDGQIIAWGMEFFEYLIEKENKEKS